MAIVFCIGLLIFVSVSLQGGTAVFNPDTGRSYLMKDPTGLLAKMVLNYFQLSSKMEKFGVVLGASLKALYAGGSSMDSGVGFLPEIGCAIPGWNSFWQFITMLFFPVGVLPLCAVMPAIFFLIRQVTRWKARRRVIKGTFDPFKPSEVSLPFGPAATTTTAPGKILWGLVPVTPKARSLGEIYLMSIVVVVYLLYTNIIASCTQMLSCVTFQTSETVKVSVMEKDFSVDCEGAGYTVTRSLAIISLLVYGFGLPLAFLLMMLMFRRRIGLLRASRMFSFMVLGYAERTWFWETWQMLRKFVVILFISLISDSRLAAYSSMWFLSLSLIIHILVRPYIENLHNRLEAFWLVALVLQWNASLLYYWRAEALAGQGHNSVSACQRGQVCTAMPGLLEVFITMLILFTWVFVMLVLAFFILRELRSKWHRQLKPLVIRGLASALGGYSGYIRRLNDKLDEKIAEETKSVLGLQKSPNIDQMPDSPVPHVSPSSSPSPPFGPQ
eukprot:NODE_878_length_1723_cov_5.240741_g716_i0.p1 GENE.NODE_878_length_1723_cov_5.240741_g716_i0~~NODE_878_length_1723_cov_5.240741_g716_i0.p1  ORF type:complete len:511 (-),score=133.60 NODE_878_length_1723_cov_5.240741_g716_i0:190-1686(-)